MGFLEEELPLIRKEFDLDETGLIRNDNQENSVIGRRMVDGMLDSVDATIMSGNAMHIPTFMSDRGVMLGLILYCLSLWDTLLKLMRNYLRGIQEADARTIVSVGFNTMLFMLMYQVRDAMKPEEIKRKKDMMVKMVLLLVMDGIKMNSFIGAVPSLADFGYGTLTGKNLFDDKKGWFSNSFIY